jgi:hypothetical protein
MKHHGGLVAMFVAISVFVCLQCVAGREAYVTLVANDEYAIGARALGASLRATGTSPPFPSPTSCRRGALVARHS